MCPTLVATADGRLLALGAAGGRRILPAVLQLASFLVDGGDDVATALARPRIDVSGPEAALLDRRLDAASRTAVAGVLPASLAADDVYPAPFAIPTILALGADGTRTAMGAPVHPWAGAVTA
jgi:gamma-glutamyltranspeptidase/glutathione hydrolase